MIEFINQNIFLLACLSAGLCVTFMTYVVIDFFNFASSKYKEKFESQVAVEMDDIFLQMPPSKILDLSLALAVLAAFIGGSIVCTVMDHPGVIQIAFVSTLGAVVAFPAPRLILRYMWNKRMMKFNEQLEDGLLSISSSLKAGFSINQALEVVAKENRSPISYEFTLLTQELRLGVPFEEALTKMTKRLKSPDFELVSVAIITARQTGGELTAVLERLAAVIRERIRIMQRVHSLTAQGRMQAWMIGAVPYLLFIAMMYISPAMMKTFFSSVTGILIILCVIIMDVVGFLVIRKITQIDI